MTPTPHKTPLLAIFLTLSLTAFACSERNTQRCTSASECRDGRACVDGLCTTPSPTVDAGRDAEEDVREDTRTDTKEDPPDTPQADACERALDRINTCENLTLENTDLRWDTCTRPYDLCSAECFLSLDNCSQAQCALDPDIDCDGSGPFEICISENCSPPSLAACYDAPDANVACNLTFDCCNGDWICHDTNNPPDVCDDICQPEQPSFACTCTEDGCQKTPLDTPTPTCEGADETCVAEICCGDWFCIDDRVNYECNEDCDGPQRPAESAPVCICNGDQCDKRPPQDRCEEALEFIWGCNYALFEEHEHFKSVRNRETLALFTRMFEDTCSPDLECVATCIQRSAPDGCQALDCHTAHDICSSDPLQDCVRGCREDATPQQLCNSTDGQWTTQDACPSCCGPTACGEELTTCTDACCGEDQCSCPPQSPFWSDELGCLPEALCQGE